MLLILITTLQTCLGLYLNRGCLFSRERGIYSLAFGGHVVSLLLAVTSDLRRWLLALHTRVLQARSPRHPRSVASLLLLLSLIFQGEKKAVAQTGREDEQILVADKKRPGSSSEHHRGAHLR